MIHTQTISVSLSVSVELSNNEYKYNETDEAKENEKKDMDNGGGFNHKFSSSRGMALTRSTIANINNDDDDDDTNFTLASNRARGRRFSSIETTGNSSSGSSDISNWSNEATTAAAAPANGEIRTRNLTANHRHEHEINYRRDFDEARHNQPQFRHHRWTSVNSSVDKLPTKSYVIDKTGGLNQNQFVSTNNINDTHSTNANGDKAKWTHKTPINGNIAV